MICYLIRHGQDDESVRGGWSNHPLTAQGIRQAERLAKAMMPLGVGVVYSSDLCRAMQTAQILADKLRLPIIPLSGFREVNNGELAGMKNTVALQRYPGLYWNQLGWEQCYPGGESPRQFYDRISKAWADFSKIIAENNENVVLVTHGGVIHVIRAVLENRPYCNTQINPKVAYTEVIPIAYENGCWKEQQIKRRPAWNVSTTKPMKTVTAKFMA